MKVNDFLQHLINQQKMTLPEKFDLTGSQFDMFSYVDVQHYILDNHLSKNEISRLLMISKYDAHFVVWREPYLTLIIEQKFTFEHAHEFSLLAKSWQVANTPSAYLSLHAWLDQSPSIPLMLAKGLLAPVLIKSIRRLACYSQLTLLDKCVFASAIEAHNRGAPNLSKALEILLNFEFFSSFLQRNLLKPNLLLHYFNSPLKSNIQTLIFCVVQSDFTALNLLLKSPGFALVLLKDVPALTNIILFHLLSDRDRYLQKIYFFSDHAALLEQVTTQVAVKVNPTLIRLLQQIPSSNIKLDRMMIYDDLRIKLFSRYLVTARHEADNPRHGFPLEVLTLIAANAACENSLFSKDEQMAIAHTYLHEFEAGRQRKRMAAALSSGLFTDVDAGNLDNASVATTQVLRAT